jgi:2-hydroxychromene-2-carboxylate isomerase
MGLEIDYYFAPQSPWTYLGHERFRSMAQRVNAKIRVRPIDLGGRVFPVSGGVPLGQRAPQRQAYRLAELRRFADWLGLPIHTNPTFFPVRGDPAAHLITLVDLKDGPDAAMRLTGRTLSAVWAENRDIASEDTLATLLRECKLDPKRLPESMDPAVTSLYETHTQCAIDAGVFGAPSYVMGSEIFWGQDRLDFVERRLALEGD